MSSREELVFIAKLAEQGERYDDMLDCMKQVATMGHLSVEERNLFSVAWKNVTGARRAALRIVTSIQHKASARNDEARNANTAAYMDKLNRELQSICDECLALLRDHCLPRAEDAHSRVFFHKMRADYLRYKCEFLARDEEFSVARDEAEMNYATAFETSVAELPATDPIRLGLMLNYSVYLYEIREDAPRALEVAKNAFDQAIQGLDTIPELIYKDATLIMQLLRDNVTLWQHGGLNDFEDDVEMA